MSGDPRYHPHGEPPPWPPRPAPPSPLLSILVVLLLLGVVAVAGGLLFVWWRMPSGQTGVNPDAQPRAVTARGDLAELEKTSIDVYKKNRPSVVHVTTLVQQSTFGTASVPSGTGSGFVWDVEGHVVTNFHVIKDANAARLTFSDKTTYPAYYVGGAPEKDLAVLYVQAPKEKLRPIPLGTSADLQVGQLAFAIGNPFGLDYTYTMGIVSALDREIESVVANQHISNVIQTDAAINPGNSGGPLLDSAGRLIGVNTAIYSKTGASAGIGFAIPVDEVNRVVPDLIRNGRKDVPKQQEKKTRPGLGIQVASDELAQQHGVKSGAAIAKVLPGTGADKAGLLSPRRTRTGEVLLDVIVSIDDKPVANVEDLMAALKGYKVGDVVTVEIVRQKERLTKKVTLGPVD